MDTLTYYPGDTIAVEVVTRWESTRLPIDLTGAKIIATCKQRQGAAAVWTKRNSLNGGSDAEVYLGADPTLGVVTIYATGTESAAMLVDADYRLDCVARLTTGVVVTLMVVKIRMLERPTTGTVA